MCIGKRKQTFIYLSLILSLGLVATVSFAARSSPNILLIVVDDLGYADIGAFGNPKYATPHLDQLAKEGRRFTDFSVSAPVCSASRAAIMTGALHARVDINGAYGPKSEKGLNPSEKTIAEVCKEKGYATAIYGKWHLGHHPKFLPTNQGFDEYHGLPFSNDMWLWHPRYHGLSADDPKRRQSYKELPLIENEAVADANVTAEEQAHLTRWATERAVGFIERNADQPFFLYLPYSMVHVPIFASNAYLGKSGAGLFGDVMMELDASVGAVLGALKRSGLEDDTLVIFTSDNGPWVSYGDHAGSAEPYREAKGTTFEGGVRVPTIFKWPGKIPADTDCDLFAATIDLMPTITRFTGGTLPEKIIDGKDISGMLLADKVERSPHAYYPLHYRGELQAVRSESWKLVFPHKYRTLNGRPGGTDGLPVKYDNPISELALYNLDADPEESRNVIKEYPEIFDELSAVADRYRSELGDRLQKVEGSGVRPSGVIGEGDKLLEW